MKRFTVSLALALSALLSLPLYAVERAGKSGDKKQDPRPATNSVAPVGGDTARKSRPDSSRVRRPSQGQGSSGQKRVDTFVDRNNNGIDDRKESIKSKQGTPPEKSPK